MIAKIDSLIVDEIYKKIFLNIHSSGIDMFLCGGASDKEHTSNRDLLRDKLKVKGKISILYPEDLFMEMLNRKKYDLLTLEKFLADNSDIICIVCESPGSFVELGAFVNNENTFKKVVVLIQKKYKNAKSFITQGPVSYVRSNKPENVIYINNNIDEAAENIEKLIKKKFWLYGYRHRKFEKSIKDINLISGQYYFIILMLFFYNQIEVKNLVNILKELYTNRGYKDLEFEMIFMSAIRRMYKEGMLKKVIISQGNSVYELTDKGYEYAKEIISYVELYNRTTVIDGLRLKIIRSKYY